MRVCMFTSKSQTNKSGAVVWRTKVSIKHSKAEKVEARTIDMIQQDTGKKPQQKKNVEEKA